MYFLSVFLSVCYSFLFYGPCCLNKINDDDDDFLTPTLIQGSHTTGVWNAYRSIVLL